LANAGLPVAVVNPRQVRDFARAMGRLAKTDALILDADPLAGARNYRSIHAVIQEGRIVDRDALPVAPIFTKRAGPN
jgi:transposase